MQKEDIQINTIPYKVIVRNILIFTIVMLLLGEVLFRKRYAAPERTATPEILAIQEHLQLHPTLGFTWKPNVSETDKISFENQDAVDYSLSTDQWGFINTSEAIAARESTSTVNIVGLGDSFMEHGTHVLTEFFASNNLNYYNLAMHRQSPPQYTDILEIYALPLKPDWIIYSIFENDFQEIIDYQNWNRSKLDWFTFHSGTWCGSPLPQTASERFRTKYFKGYSALYSAIQSKLLGDSLSIDGPPIGSPALIIQEIIDAHTLAQHSGTKFIVLLVPGRGSVLTKQTLEAGAYDTLIQSLSRTQINIIDLRTIFRDQSDPASLYYQINGHWNPKGITIAAQSLLTHIKSHPQPQEPESSNEL